MTENQKKTMLDVLGRISEKADEARRAICDLYDEVYHIFKKTFNN